VVEDRHATPADVAATRIDFADWLQTLSRRYRRIAETLATGEGTGTVARRFRLSPSRISQLRHEYYESWKRFQGEEGGPSVFEPCWVQ
jgi:FixJ family two-component response regulator